MFRNRWVRRAVAGLVVTVVVGVAGLLYLRSSIRRAGTERFNAAVAHLDATDPGWRLDDLEAARGHLPDDQNSTLLVPRFKAALAGKEFAPARPGPQHRGVFEDVPPNRTLDTEGAAALDRATDKNAAALGIARSFKDPPRGLRRYAITADVIGTLLPGLQETRWVAAMLDAEAERLSRDGRPGAALQLTLAMVNVGRSIDGEWTLIAHLVRMACEHVTVRRVERTLGLGQPTAGLAELQAAFAADAEVDLFRIGVRGERAGLDRLFTNLRGGTVPVQSMLNIADTRTGNDPPPAPWHWVAYQPHMANDHAVLLESLTKVLDVTRLPDHHQRAALKQVMNPPREYGARLTNVLMPAVHRVHDASLRRRAQLRCAAVGLAVERYRLRFGSWPASLAEVPTDLLPTVPLDPFDGNPLKYARRADGATIYSIGVDETDDGGAVTDGPQLNKTGVDVGFRLYDPAARGLPPLPEPGRPLPVEVPDTEYGPMPREVGDTVGS
jgi:hypothetical protein